MEYNTQLQKLALPEYGRNIHKMVEWVKNIKDRDKRNEQIHAVIAVMGNLNPHLRDINDFKHKLWDHIQVISDFQIDIDSPYPIPPRETLHDKPQIVPYPKGPVRFPHYGRNIQSMIKAVVQMEEGEHKNATILAVANQMKKAYVMWNKDSVKDDQIFTDLRNLSNGAINMSEATTKLCSGHFPSANTNSNSNKNGKNGKSYQQKNNGKNNKNKGKRRF